MRDTNVLEPLPPAQAHCRDGGRRTKLAGRPTKNHYVEPRPLGKLPSPSKSASRPKPGLYPKRCQDGPKTTVSSQDRQPEWFQIGCSTQGNTNSKGIRQASTVRKKGVLQKCRAH